MSDTKIKLLIIDDEEDFSFFLGKNLERLNIYEIILAKDGKAGLKKAKIELDRKVLSELAQKQPKVFAKIVAQVK